MMHKNSLHSVRESPIPATNSTVTQAKNSSVPRQTPHWSPLEMVSACMEITTTRDIARQILRHRSFSFQEFSQRYADPTKDLEFVTRSGRLQDTQNRQNSIEHDDTCWRTNGIVLNSELSMRPDVSTNGLSRTVLPRNRLVLCYPKD
jgi:hypothetical protein